MSKLYLLEDDYALEMTNTPFENEDYLQRIIEKTPDLVARPTEGQTPPRHFLVKREKSAKAPDSTELSLDHLIVDADGIPVLVEAKRGSNTQIRRLVIAQILDYACRASSWTAEELERDFKATNPNSDFELPKDFWDKVKKHLDDGEFRLVIAADDIPVSLRMLIEFLDKAMPKIEVYGVELRPYVSNGKTMLFSSIVGNATSMTEKPTAVKGRRTWDDEAFSQYLHANGLQKVVGIVDAIRSEAVKLGYEKVLGQGAFFPSFLAKLNGLRVFTVSVWEYGGNLVPSIEICPEQLSVFMGEDWPAERVRSYLLDSAWLAKAKESSSTRGLDKMWMMADLTPLADSPEAIKSLIETIAFLHLRITENTTRSE